MSFSWEAESVRLETSDMVGGWEYVGEEREEILKEATVGIRGPTLSEVCPWFGVGRVPLLSHLYTTLQTFPGFVVMTDPIILSKYRSALQAYFRRSFVFSSCLERHILVGVPRVE